MKPTKNKKSQPTVIHETSCCHKFSLVNLTTEDLSHVHALRSTFWWFGLERRWVGRHWLDPGHLKSYPLNPNEGPPEKGPLLNRKWIKEPNQHHNFRRQMEKTSHVLETNWAGFLWWGGGRVGDWRWKIGILTERIAIGFGAESSNPDFFFGMEFCSQKKDM